MRLAIITLIVFFCSLTPHAAILPPGFIEVPLATGLDPTGMTQAPDGRIFIIEKYGAVRVVENGVLLPDPMVLLNVDNYNERGLSGITLHPDFASNGYIYLYYTLKNAGYNRLVRLKAIGNYADPLSEEVIFEGDPLFGTIHNGGAMSFGADGKLYLAVGDGAYGNNAPDMTSLLGKVIRLNDDGSIPADNPFYNTNTGKYRAIYASGLRNPFSLTIQPGTGKIFVCDVGSEFHEEVNQIEAGGFYGWNILEGKKDWQDLPSNYHDPVYTYSHAEGCAVVGAAFYNPPVTPFPQNFVGKFFFGDYCKNRIRVLNPTTGFIEQTFATQIDRPLVLLTGLDGSLYYISRGGTGGGSESDNTSSNEGMLWKISYVGAGAPVFSLLPQNTLVVAGEQAEFNAYANGTPPLEYQWEKNGVALLNEKGTTLSLASVSLADSGALFRCLVMNGYGQVSSPEAMLRVTSNQRPMPVITSPSPDYHYQAGVPFTFAGFATDLETGTLGPDDLTWRIDLHHDDHTHPGMPATPGIENGTFQLPTIGETADNVWIRILLSAKDQIGLTRTVYQDLFPQKSTIRVETNPAGIPIRIDGKTSTTPVESASVSGLRRVVDAPRLFTLGDSIYIFRDWQDGSTFPQIVGSPTDSLVIFRGFYSPIKTGTGTGLMGTYYDSDGSGSFNQKLLSRVDSLLNFNWENNSPDPVLPADHFSVRWEGYIEPLFSGYYTFALATDDGCRVWVNNQQIIDAWVDKNDYEVYGSTYMENGKRYPIRVEYYENGGGAVAQMRWSTPKMDKAIVPQSQLYPLLPKYDSGQKTIFNWVLAPNPVGSGYLHLGIEASHKEYLSLNIIDAAGRLVRTWDANPIDEAQSVLDIPVDDLAPGIYFVELIGQVYAGKTVKQFIKI